MWWFWLKFQSKSDNIVSSNFFPSAEYISMLQIQPDTASHNILTNTPYFVIFPGLYVLNFRRPRHGIMASSSDSSCFGLYTDLNFCTEYSWTGQILNSRPEPCFCCLLSLKCQACQMDSKRFLLIVWGKMDAVTASSNNYGRRSQLFTCNSWGARHCHCPKFHCHLSETSERVSAYNSHKISSSFRTFLRKAVIATEGS